MFLKDTPICILTMVDLSKGAASIPEVKGVYRCRHIARDNAIVLLCGKAAEWDIPESAVDTENLRVADEFGTNCVQMKCTEVMMSVDASFEVI